jgi:hypothetical protein
MITGGNFGTIQTPGALSKSGNTIIIKRCYDSKCGIATQGRTLRS